ncbi:MAG: hypothetical protein FWE03_07500 [Firmicutes bacterium]|nr:hypothetical protein [Bacillota bacterium]
MSKQAIKKASYLIASLFLGMIIALSLNIIRAENQINAQAMTHINAFGMDLSHSQWDDDHLKAPSTNWAQKFACESFSDHIFSEYSLSVVLTRQASMQLREITIHDFPELQLTEVVNTNITTKEIVQNQLEQM